MSKSNPFKKKRREAKKTALLYCEGIDEKTFLSYLKMLFAKDSGVFVTIKENHGGEANGVLNGVLKQDLRDWTVCMYDIDTGFDVDLKREVEEKGILCLENDPCLEVFLLNILETKNYLHYKNQKSGDCKKIFETKYLSNKKRKDKSNYKKIFPKELLIKRAKDIKNLKTLIDLIRGKYEN